jgi:hypothetical protein
MPAVLTRNPAPNEDIVDPVKNDGSRYRFEMICEQGRSRAYADTAVDLLDVLMPGYGALPEDERIKARVEYATGLLAPMQATILQNHDQSQISDEDKAVLLQPRYEPVQVEEWSSEVPLVLLDVHYQPFGDVPAPMSMLEDVVNPRNIVWIRASDEFEMLLSLNRVGFISLGENNDFAV